MLTIVTLLIKIFYTNLPTVVIINSTVTGYNIKMLTAHLHIRNNNPVIDITLINDNFYFYYLGVWGKADPYCYLLILLCVHCVCIMAPLRKQIKHIYKNMHHVSRK